MDDAESDETSVESGSFHSGLKLILMVTATVFDSVGDILPHFSEQAETYSSQHSPTPSLKPTRTGRTLAIGRLSFPD